MMDIKNDWWIAMIEDQHRERLIGADGKLWDSCKRLLADENPYIREGGYILALQMLARLPDVPPHVMDSLCEQLSSPSVMLSTTIP